MDTYTARTAKKLISEHIKDLRSLADGWQAGTVKFADNQPYAAGLGICAKQLYETINRLERDYVDWTEDNA